MLIEGDPHQILEGVLISAYALQVTPGLHLPARRVRPGPRAPADGAERGLRPRRGGKQHFRLGLLARHRRAPGRRRLHLRRGDGAARVARGQARLPAHQASVLPGRHRPLRRAHRGQQRRDHGQHPLDREQRRCRVRRPRCRPLHRDAAVRAGRPRAQPGQLRARDGQDHVPRPDLRTRCSAAASAAPTRSRRSSPAACRPRGSARTRWTSRSGQDEVGNAGSMLGSGSVVVMDSATCMVRAAWRITKFFSRESCGQCTPCREGVGLAGAHHVPN